MKSTIIFTVLLLVGFAFTAPTTKDDTITITGEFFPESLVKYRAEHDIVKILVPLNALNFEDDADDANDDTNSDTVLFFVEADIDPNNYNQREYKGLYILKEGKATKLLENGRDATAANDDTKFVYFGASDGIYVYDSKENKAVKFGSVVDPIRNIVKENGTDVIYILTDDKQVYRVTDEGNKKTKVAEINNAVEIVLDYSNNVYFYGDDKNIYVLNVDGVKEISLPKNCLYLRLLTPPFIIEDGIPIVCDENSYIIYANGTVEKGDFVLEVKPTAYSMEATLIQYYAYNKKIYEYNILVIILSEILEGLKDFLDGFKDNIESIATRSRNDLRA